MRVYLIGPMSGYPAMNFPMFDSCAERLRDLGHDVVNPADLDRAAGFNPAEDEITPEFLAAAAKRDIPALMSCQAIALLPRWQESHHGKIEYSIAKWLNLKELDALTGSPYRHESVTEEAQRITTRDRRDDYGHPYDDFGLVAALWSPLLGVDVTREQVGLCMIQLKIAREAFRPKRDNRTDICGYANTLQMIADKKQELSNAKPNG